MARRSMADFLTQQRQTEDNRTEDVAPPAPRPSAEPSLPSDLPRPYETTAEGALSARERDDLAACEVTIDRLRTAFAFAGQALQTIRDGRLYRETHDTFEDYCRERWDMTRQQASRLIISWPLAERLSPMGDKLINERQVRELLPLAERYGDDAAITVYETLATTDGLRVTARLVKDTVAIVDADVDHFDHDEAVDRIRNYLAGTYAPPSQPVTDVFTTELTRMRSIATRVARRVDDQPERAREFAAELRELADRIDRQLD